MGPVLGKFSFRVGWLQQTKAGLTVDANPLSHEPHFPRHMGAGTAVESTFVSWPEAAMTVL